MVYDTTLNNLFIWNGSAWESVPASGDAGANGAVQYNDNGVVAGAANFFWDKVNNRVGINSPTPSQALTVGGSIEATGGVAGQGALIGRDGGSGGATYGSNTGNTNVNAPAGGAIRFNVNNGVFAGLFDTSGNLGVLNSSPFSGTSGGLTIGTVGTGSAKQLALQMANCYARLRERNVVNDFSITTNINVDNVLDDNTRPSWMIRLGAGTDLFSVFRAAAGSTTFTTLATINPVGDINLIGNLVPTNGKGIDFSATPGTGTSELLSDYEEGSWTPVVADASTGGNTGTCTINIAKYVKIGRQVSVQCDISAINTTGMTAGNAFFIRGLPFTSVQGGNGNFYTYRVGRDAATVSSSAFVGDSSSWLVFPLYTTNSATTDLRILVSDIVSTTSQIILSLTYFV